MKKSTRRLCLAGGFLILGVSSLAILPISGEAAFSLPFTLSGTTTASIETPPVQSVAYRPNRVRRDLRADGWRNIVFVDRKLPVYVVRACRDRRRFELRLNRFGKVQRRSELGPCRVAASGSDRTDRPGYRMSVRNVRRVLDGLGYKDIKFRDRELPVYVADGCLRRSLYRLRINRRGDINFRERIGRCGRGGQRREVVRVRLPEIEAILEARGFNRIKFTDRRLPTYKAEACKNNRKMELKINSRGEIRDRRRIGECREIDGDNILKVSEITKLLQARRYYRIRYTDRELPWYKATACRDRKEFSLLMNRWGDIRRRRQSGVCEAPQRTEVVAIAPRRRFDYELVRRRERIDADECQDYYEDLLADNTINFDTNSATIQRESYDLLERLATVATRCPETNVEIAGHTDSVGSQSSNQKLSERRAQSVVDFLMDRRVPRENLSARGYGEERPVASNTTDRGKARNRRIEFVASWGE